ncbi:MAG: hypothetical protein Kow0074_09080 [Candidatus Zixiibacteriota bacterium]
MVTINYAFREISCKIVYYGPGLSGKTTNLQYVHERVPAKSRGDLISLATEADRTLYFDFLPISVGDIAGFATKFQLYTVPGQVFYNATRKLVLRGVDGIVFVADSQRSKMDENIESLTNMYENLKENGIDIQDIPIVIQYNKRDLPDVMPIEELERELNPHGYPYTEAVAVKGTGVFDTLKRITKIVLEHTKKKTSVGGQSAQPSGTDAEPVGVGASVSSAPLGASPAGRSFNTPGPAPAAARGPQSAVAAAPERPAPARRTTMPSAPVQATVDTPSAAPTASKMQEPPTSQPSTSARAIYAPQRSLRVRSRKNRSLFSRLFGWLFGR